jgi:hypothetical protein
MPPPALQLGQRVPSPAGLLLAASEDGDDGESGEQRRPPVGDEGELQSVPQDGQHRVHDGDEGDRDADGVGVVPRWDPPPGQPPQPGAHRTSGAPGDDGRRGRRPECAHHDQWHATGTEDRR